MFRRLVVLCAVLGVLTGCDDAVEVPAKAPAAQRSVAPAPEGYWLTEPASDAGRRDLLAWVREVDMCALLPRDAVAEFGTVLRAYNEGPSSCTVTLNSDEMRDRTEFSLSVLVRNPGVPSHTEGIPVRMVEGAEVTSVRDFDHLDEKTSSQALHRSCTVSAGYPSQVLFMLYSVNPLGAEPCPTGEKVMDRVLAEWKNQPRQGTSPDTTLTVVNRIDPCAVADRLGASVPADGLGLWSCDFSYRGDEIGLSYELESEKLLEGPAAVTVGPHTAIVASDPEDDFVLYWATIGPVLERPEPTSFFGGTRPSFTVHGRDPAVVEEVTRAALAAVPE